MKRLGICSVALAILVSAGCGTSGPSPTPKEPLLAIASFGAEEAKKHQQVWADHVGLPVEKNVVLSGGAKMTLVLIPAGEFMMGTSTEEMKKFLQQARAAGDQHAVKALPYEGTPRRVRITRPFYLGKYEVTQAQWQAVMGDNPSHFQSDPSHPVEQVSWDDVQKFISQLNHDSPQKRMEFVLPTNGQWELACRAGATTYWHFGDDEELLKEYAWYSNVSTGKTHPVGRLKPNAWGLYDMHGNVMEWCSDLFGPYDNDFEIDPVGAPTGKVRVYRNGSYGNAAWYCRSSFHSGIEPTQSSYNLGFRLAANITDD